MWRCGLRIQCGAPLYAVEHLGFHLVHVDGDGRHYLGAEGPDTYSLVYVPGEGGPAIEYGAFAVPDVATLDVAAGLLEARGITVVREDVSPLFRHGPAITFDAPGGASFMVTTGVAVPSPVAQHTPAPQRPVAPICCDHFIDRTTDVPALNAFAQDVLGLKFSAQVQFPNGDPLLSFFRSHTLFHCFGTAASPFDGVHHVQFTLKNDRAVFNAFDALRTAGEVDIAWGPLRHGCGQNVAIYLLDAEGYVFEYSAEEELILNDECYEPQIWPLTDAHAVDEWSRQPPPDRLK